MISLAKKECPICHSEWIARVPDPVRCPRCKRVIIGIETGPQPTTVCPATTPDNGRAV